MGSFCASSSAMVPELVYSPIETCLFSPAESDIVHTPFIEPHDGHDFELTGSPAHRFSRKESKRAFFSPSSPLGRRHHPCSPYPFRDSPPEIHAFEDSPSSGCSGADHFLKKTNACRGSPLSSCLSLNFDAHLHSPRFPKDHKLNRYFVETYQLEDELGAGGYGFVMTARHREEGREVAVKFVIKEKVPEHAWMEDENIGRLPTEVMLLSYLDHPNIVKCLDLFEDPMYFYMVQELHGSPWPKAVKERKSPSSDMLSPSNASSLPSLSPSTSISSLDSDPVFTPPATPISVRHDSSDCENDDCRHNHVLVPRPMFSRRPSHDLFECIEQSKEKRLSEDQAKHIFRQVVDAVHYLDSQGVSHRDIKDENLVVDKDLNVKLIDFGSATIVDPEEPRPYYNLFYGTTAYASAEILRKKAYQAAPAEVWTLGVLLSYLLTGTSPFTSVKDAIEGRITLSDCPPLSNAVLDMLQICLHPSPKARGTIQEVKDHVWLRY